MNALLDFQRQRHGHAGYRLSDRQIRLGQLHPAGLFHGAAKIRPPRPARPSGVGQWGKAAGIGLAARADIVAHLFAKLIQHKAAQHVRVLAQHHAGVGQRRAGGQRVGALTERRVHAAVHCRRALTAGVLAHFIIVPQGVQHWQYQLAVR